MIRQWAKIWILPSDSKAARFESRIASFLNQALIRTYVAENIVVNSSCCPIIGDDRIYEPKATIIDANSATKNPKSGSKVARWTDRISGITLSQRDPERQPTLTLVTPPMEAP